jgi:hypothetical protein
VCQFLLAFFLLRKREEWGKAARLKGNKSMDDGGGGGDGDGDGDSTEATDEETSKPIEQTEKAHKRSFGKLGALKKDKMVV